MTDFRNTTWIWDFLSKAAHERPPPLGALPVTCHPHASLLSLLTHLHSWLVPAIFRLYNQWFILRSYYSRLMLFYIFWCTDIGKSISLPWIETIKIYSPISLYSPKVRQNCLHLDEKNKYIISIKCINFMEKLGGKFSWHFTLNLNHKKKLL